MGILQQNSGLFNDGGASSASFTVSLPSTTSATSRIVLIIAGNTTITTPSGFTLQASQVNWMGHYLYDCAGGAMSWTVTPSAAGQGTWYVAEVDNGAFINALGANNAGTGTTYSTLSLTPTSGERVLFASIGGMSSTVVRTVSGWTGSFVEEADRSVTTNDRPMQGVATRTVTANGSTAYSTTTTYSATSTGRSALIASYATTNANGSPTTSAGASQINIEPYSTVTLTAVDTAGANPITSSSWAWVSGGAAPTLLGSGLTRTYIAPAGNAAVTQVFRRTVSDGTLTATADVSMTAYPVGERVVRSGVDAPARFMVVTSANAVAPTTNAGVDQTSITQGATVTLTAVDTAGTNPITSSSWAWVSGGTAPTFSGSGLTRTYTAPASQVTQVFRRTVSDGTLSATDDISITTAAASSVQPGWLRTPSNTGLAAVGLTSANLTTYGTISSDLTITTPQYRKIFNMGTSQLILTGPGATLTECLVVSSRVSGHGCVQFSGAGGQQIINTDVQCTGTTGEAIAVKSWAEAKDILIHSVKITGATIAIWIDSDQNNSNPSVVSECYAYNFLPETGNQQHRDGFTRRQGTAPITVRDSWFSMSEVGVGSFVTGALFIQPTSGVVGRVNAQNCYFSGDGYNAYLQTSDSITVNNCRFKSTEWGAVIRQGTMTNHVWTNNYLYANTPGNGYQGAAVS